MKIKGKHIILGISGGIAAYKSAYLIRLFRKAGASVRVVCTNHALEFITKVTLESLSENKVYDRVFAEDNDYTTEHISLTDWGDLFVVAPATANIIGKLASGIADDALSTSLLAFDKAVFLAPAMNVKMWRHFSVQNNLESLRQAGIHIIEPASGYLACGYEGEGRMQEPDLILSALETHVQQSATLAGKNILVTAGPTHEALDPVRYIGNHSSGLMGFSLAEELACRGAGVELVSGPVQIKPVHPSIRLTRVRTAAEMHQACKKLFPQSHAAIMAAAVADYTPASPATKKIKKEENPQELQLKLIPTTDILLELGQMKQTGQVLVGFALETDREEENALRKLRQKNLDFIVLNSLAEAGAGFSGPTNKITIIDNKDQVSRYSLKSKQAVAADIVDKIVQYMAH